jgi:hypothetical protein
MIVSIIDQVRASLFEEIEFKSQTLGCWCAGSNVPVVHGLNHFLKDRLESTFCLHLRSLVQLLRTATAVRQ